jgi:hypothetical protein
MLLQEPEEAYDRITALCKSLFSVSEVASEQHTTAATAVRAMLPRMARHAA